MASDIDEDGGEEGGESDAEEPPLYEDLEGKVSVVLHDIPLTSTLTPPRPSLLSSVLLTSYTFRSTGPEYSNVSASRDTKCSKLIMRRLKVRKVSYLVVCGRFDVNEAFFTHSNWVLVSSEEYSDDE